MAFSEPQQDHTTPSHQRFLGLAPYVALVLIWAIEMQHARPPLAKDCRKSIRLVDTIALLFALSLPSGKKFLVPSMAFS